MKQIGKNCAVCLVWLLISEIMCLVLAFSFAILRPDWLRWLSMACGITAHILLMGSCAQKIADADAAEYRRSGLRIPRKKPVLLSLFVMLPQIILYLLLWLNAESSAMLNAFLLLNAPFIQLHRLLIGGAEPFSAVPMLQQILMVLPALVTAAAWYSGYTLRYARRIAEITPAVPRP